MFIEILVDFINLLKNQGQARYYNPEDIMLAFNRAQLDLFREYFKIFEETREVSDSLNPFKVNHTFSSPQATNQLPAEYAHLTNFSVLIGTQEYPGKIVTDALWNVRELSVLQREYGDNVEPFIHEVPIALSAGQGNLPDDYVHRIDVDTGVAEVDITNPQKFVKRKNDKTYPPATENPIGTIEGNLLKVLPASITAVQMHYYRYPAATRPICRVSGDKLLVKPTTGNDEIKISFLQTPPDAVYAYTVVSGRDLAFDVGNSTDTIFRALDQSALVIKTLQYLGVPLKDSILLQFDNMKLDIKPEQNG